MHRFSYLQKLVAVVALLLLLPALLPATNPTCAPPHCPANCEGGYDCTSEWMAADWNNMVLAMTLWAMGYTVIVCCSD